MSASPGEQQVVGDAPHGADDHEDDHGEEEGPGGDRLLVGGESGLARVRHGGDGPSGRRPTPGSARGGRAAGRRGGRAAGGWAATRRRGARSAPPTRSRAAG